jgi:polyhydroxybutyrate depolymerase
VHTTLTVAGRTRSYAVVGAPDGPADRALVLVFHGSKQDGAAHRRMTGGALDRLADEGRAVVAYLDGYRGNWNDARAASRFPARLEDVDDVGFAAAVVDALVGSHRVDRGAVVAVGYSNGGQMVFRLLHERADLLAGAVVVAATMPDADGFLGGFSEHADRPVPVALVAGTADRIVPVGGGRMAWWARALFRVDGTALSAEGTAGYFARRNGITAAPATVDLPARPRGRRRVPMRRTTFREAGRAPVTLDLVLGGGHTVPGPTAGPAVLGRTGTDRGVDELVDDVLAEVRAHA